MCDVILTVACDTGHSKTFHIHGASSAIHVEHIIDGACVIALEHVQVEHILAHIDFVGHFNDLVFAIAVEDDNVVDVGAVAHIFIFLEPCADEAVGAVDVEFLVGFGHFGGNNGVKLADDGATRILVAVLGLEPAVPFDGVVDHMRQFVVNVGNALFE